MIDHYSNYYVCANDIFVNIPLKTFLLQIINHIYYILQDQI